MLLYYKQEDLEKLMTSLSRVHLSSSVPNAKAWVPSSRIFSVKSFLLALTILFFIFFIGNDTKIY